MNTKKLRMPRLKKRQKPNFSLIVAANEAEKTCTSNWGQKSCDFNINTDFFHNITQFQNQNIRLSSIKLTLTSRTFYDSTWNELTRVVARPV